MLPFVCYLMWIFPPSHSSFMYLPVRHTPSSLRISVLSSSSLVPYKTPNWGSARLPLAQASMGSAGGRGKPWYTDGGAGGASGLASFPRKTNINHHHKNVDFFRKQHSLVFFILKCIFLLLLWLGPGFLAWISWQKMPSPFHELKMLLPEPIRINDIVFK